MKRSAARLETSMSSQRQTDGISKVINEMVNNWLKSYSLYYRNNEDLVLPSAKLEHNSVSLS